MKKEEMDPYCAKLLEANKLTKNVISFICNNYENENLMQTLLDRGDDDIELFLTVIDKTKTPQKITPKLYNQIVQKFGKHEKFSKIAVYMFEYCGFVEHLGDSEPQSQQSPEDFNKLLKLATNLWNGNFANYADFSQKIVSLDKARIMNHEADSLSTAMWNKYMQPGYFYNNYQSDSYYIQRTNSFVEWFIEIGAPLPQNLQINLNFPMARIMEHVIKNKEKVIGQKVFRTTQNSYSYTDNNSSGYYSNMSSYLTSNSPNLYSFTSQAITMKQTNPYFDNEQGESYIYSLSTQFDSYVLRQSNYSYHSRTEMFIYWYFELGAYFYNNMGNNYLYNHLFDRLVKSKVNSNKLPRIPLTPDSSEMLTGPQKEAIFDERVKRAISRLKTDNIVIKQDKDAPTIASLSKEVQTLIAMNKELQREIRALKEENEKFKEKFENIGAVCSPPKN